MRSTNLRIIFRGKEAGLSDEFNQRPVGGYLMELAVIGKSDFVTGFRLAGIRKVYETADVTATRVRGKICASR